MKIIILKDIPGYKAGDTIKSSQECGSDLERFRYDYQLLIDTGWAKEFTHGIDIIEIRKKPLGDDGPARYINMSHPTYDWFKAYQIVKTVIDELNEDWKEKWRTEQANCLITCEYKSPQDPFFRVVKYANHKMSILPNCKDEATAEKVIELCKPELEVLFGVK